jgi:hypothetical protein
MPVSEYDLIKAGMSDFRLDNLRVSCHALKRCKERKIPLEDLRRKSNNINGRAIIKKDTIVTAITNQMYNETKRKKSIKVQIKEQKRKDRQHQVELQKEKNKLKKKDEIAKSKNV